MPNILLRPHTHLESLILIISSPNILVDLLEVFHHLLVHFLSLLSIPFSLRDRTGHLIVEFLFIEIGSGVSEDLGVGGQLVVFEEGEEGGVGLKCAKEGMVSKIGRESSTLR